MRAEFSNKTYVDAHGKRSEYFCPYKLATGIAATTLYVHNVLAKGNDDDNNDGDQRERRGERRLLAVRFCACNVVQGNDKRREETPCPRVNRVEAAKTRKENGGETSREEGSKDRGKETRFFVELKHS